MIYFRIFTILLATAFMLVVFYGDLSTVTSLLAGLCGGLSLWWLRRITLPSIEAIEQRLEDLEAKLIEG